MFFQNKNSKKIIVSALLLVFTINFSLPSIVIAGGVSDSWEGPSNAGLTATETLSNTPVLGGILTGGVYLFAAIGLVFQTLVNLLMKLVGLAYDLVITLNTGFNTNVETITVGWKLSRDIANMFFIFILLFIAITTMLRVSGYETKVLLRKLIVIALLINFSLMVGLMIIDATNVLGNEFYMKMTDNGNSTISTKLLKGTKFQNLFNLQDGAAASLPGAGYLLWDGLTGDPKQLGSAINFAVLAWFSVILLAIFVYVLVFALMLLLVRIGVLAFLLVLMPLAFLGAILPKTENMWNKWWSTFLNHAFFFPIHMFLLYFASSFFSAVVIKSNGGGFTQDPALLLTFLITAIMLVGSLLIAKEMSIYGAGTVLKWAGAGSSMIQGAIIGGAINQSIGRLGQAIQKAAPNSYAASRVGTTMAGLGKMSPLGSRAQQTEAKSNFQLASTLKKSMPEQLKDLKESKSSEFQKKLATSMTKDEKTLTQAIKTGDTEGIAVLKRIQQAEQGEAGVKKIDKAIRAQTRAEIQASGRMTTGQFIDSLNDEQALAHIKDLSAGEQGNLAAEWQNDSAKINKLQGIVSKFDPEDKIKFKDSVGKALNKNLDKLGASFDSLPEELKIAWLDTASEMDIQKMAGKASNKNNFYDSVKKHQPNKVAVLDSAMPIVAIAKGKSAETVIPTVNMGTVAKTNLPNMGDVVLHGTVKQMNAAIDRPDLASDYKAKIQEVYETAGKDIEKMARIFEGANNASMAFHLRAQGQKLVKRLNLT